MPRLVLISGKAEAGKTLTGVIIKEKLESHGERVTFLPFASYLKFICKEHFGWNGKKDEEGRRVLQYVGTDIVRRRNPDFWVKTVADFIETFGSDFDYIISDDVRFPNEIDYFKNSNNIMFLSIRVTRLNYQSSLTEIQRQHVSETALDNYGFDFYINSESGFRNLEREINNSGLIQDWFGIEQ